MSKFVHKTRDGLSCHYGDSPNTVSLLATLAKGKTRVMNLGFLKTHQIPHGNVSRW